MPGTLANPVMLDPFQAITEVGWGAFTHVAFRVSISIDTTTQGPFACSPVVGSSSNDPHTDNYLSASSYTGGTPTGFAARKNSEWVSPPSTPTVSGLPTLPVDFSYGAWEKVAVGGSFKTFSIIGPNRQWENETVGAEIDITVPSSSDKFQSATSATATHFGDTVTGGVQCLDAGKELAPCTGSTLDDPGANASQYSPMAYSVSGVVAVMDGKAYKAIAVKPGDSLVLHVLCERSPADDPA